MTQDVLQQLDAAIRDGKAMVELARALERLQANRDFKKIIQEGYFREEAIRLVHLKADPAMQTPDRQAAILRDLDAIGALNGYFRTVMQMASLAAKEIEEAEATREEILQGGEA